MKQFLYQMRTAALSSVLVCFLLVSAAPLFAQSRYKLVNLGLFKPDCIQDDGTLYGNGETQRGVAEVFLRGHFHELRAQGLPSDSVISFLACNGYGTAVGTYSPYDYESDGDRGIVVWKNGKSSLIKGPDVFLAVVDSGGKIYTFDKAGVQSWWQTRLGWISEKIDMGRVIAARNGTVAGIAVSPVLTDQPYFNPCNGEDFCKIAFINPITDVQKSLVGKLGSVECITCNGWMCGALVVSGNKAGSEFADGFIAHNNDLRLIHIKNAKWVIVKSINSLGDAVGYFGMTMDDPQGFILKHGSTTPQVIRYPDGDNFPAFGINKHGTIIGIARLKNEEGYSGFMLTPVK